MSKIKENWRRLPILVAVVAASAVSSNFANSQEEQTELTSDQRDELTQIEAATERMLSALDAAKAEIDAESARFRADCLKVISSKAICDCLGESTPIGVDFMSYIAMTIEEHEIRQSKMSSDDRTVFEGTLTARNQCAAQNDE